MTQNTNTSEIQETLVSEQVQVSSQLSHDVRSAVLIVSVVANLIVLTAWIALQVTSQYDAQFVTLLFS